MAEEFKRNTINMDIDQHSLKSVIFKEAIDKDYITKV